MTGLTAAERRGALWLALLLLLGALRGAEPSAPAPESRRPPVHAGPVAEHATADSTPRLDLNRAGIAELEGLPGIGPVLARRILEHRRRHGPFEAVEELLAVRGVGPRLLERVRGRVRVGAPGRD